MKKKPDLFFVLTFVLGMSVVVSGYTLYEPNPEMVASQVIIR